MIYSLEFKKKKSQSLEKEIIGIFNINQWIMRTTWGNRALIEEGDHGVGMGGCNNKSEVVVYIYITNTPKPT